MTRKVGDFINPETGEKDWLEPDTVGYIILNPMSISVVGEPHEGLVNFRLDNDDNEQKILLYAEYEKDGHKVSSEPQQIDELPFAEELAEHVYKGEMVDNGPLTRSAKDKAFNDIVTRMFENGVITDGTALEGIGFVESNGKKMLTIERLEFDDDNEDESIQARLIDCAGIADLKSLTAPLITFYSNNHATPQKVSIAGIKEIKDTRPGFLKEYTVSFAKDSMVVTEEEPIEYEDISYDPEDEESVEYFVAVRRAMLDESSSSKQEVDEDLMEILDL